jgi:cytoskeletal protein CcmA (bactofilin family)
VVGKVTGDVLCAGQHVSIEGEVTGDIRSAGQLVDILARVGKNAVAFGQTVTISPPGVVNGEVLAAGQTLRITAGAVKGLAAAGQFVSLGGPVGADAKIIAETLEFGEKAKIAGALEYQSDKEVTIPTGVVTGKVSYQPLPERKDIPKAAPVKMFRKATKPWPVNALGSILFYGGVGLLFALFAPKFTAAVVERLRTQTVFSMIMGGLFLFFVPVVIILLCITILGIPAAILLALAYGLVMILARLFVAVWAGNYLVEKFLPKQKESKWLPVLLGVLALWLVFKLPFVGWLFSCLALLAGTGALVGKILTRTKKA